MKTVLHISAMLALLLFTSNPCFALWEIAPVSKERAKELGLDVRWNAAGPDDVRVEVEFKTVGLLKDVSRVDLRIGAGDKSLVVAPLKEDRSKPGCVVVSFAADRARLDQITLWLMVPESRGGTAYELRVKDFVEPG